MSNYIPTIGLEIHAELKTTTKMFCDCLSAGGGSSFGGNDPEEAHPNVNVCPICLAHPGTLPVANKRAIESVILVGMALKGEIPMTAKFDRKNYFYPDLPKGYQISQYDVPLVFGGVLNGIRLRRIHLEEDTGSLVHRGPSPSSGRSASLIDFNRVGVPLMELVTEPDVRDAVEAVAFARELQLILRYLGVSDADMDKGQMRVEVNISLQRAAEDRGQYAEKRGNENGQRNSASSPRQSATLGTKVEVKNINSFRAVQGAIDYEIKRQTEVLERGEKVVQETRGWDDVKQRTVSQRLKEEAHDYRYFPEPDIPPLDLSKFPLGEIKNRILELPQAKRVRFGKEFNLSPDKAEVLIVDREAANFFEAVVSEFGAEDQTRTDEEIALAINYLTSDLRGAMMERGLGFKELKVTPENFADLIELIAAGKLSSRSAKDILLKMIETGGDPHEILKTEGLAQVSDEGKLGEVVKTIIETNPSAVADFKKGKENALQFLVGKAMGMLKGKGNPQVLQKLFREECKR